MLLNHPAKAGAFWGTAELTMAVPGGPPSSRCVLIAVLAARWLMANLPGKATPSPVAFKDSCVFRTLRGFQYGLAKSLLENRQVMDVLVIAMGITDAAHLRQTNCRSPGPNLSDTLRFGDLEWSGGPRNRWQKCTVSPKLVMVFDNTPAPAVFPDFWP